MMNLSKFWHLLGVAILALSVSSIANAADEAPSVDSTEDDGSTLQQRASRWFKSSHIKMPKIEALSVGEQAAPTVIEPKPGEVLGVMFLASYDLASQEIMDEVKRLAERYAETDFRLVFVFTHDFPDDARGFIEEYKLPGGVLATREVLTAFKGPPLPSVFVSDRRGWMVGRFIGLKSDGLTDLDYLLRYVTAI